MTIQVFDTYRAAQIYAQTNATQKKYACRIVRCAMGYEVIVEDESYQASIQNPSNRTNEVEPE